MGKTVGRLLKIDLPKGQSAFLWGPRKTGKTTYLKAAFPNSLIFDMLQTDLFLEFAKRPFLLREQLLAEKPERLKAPIIIDEVQKAPQLKAFIQEHHPRKSLVVCNERAPRIHEGIQILPWRDFLSMLWDGRIIS